MKTVKMDYSSSKRQDKRDSKKKHDSKTIYTSKHIRITLAFAEKSSKHSKPLSQPQSKSTK